MRGDGVPNPRCWQRSGWQGACSAGLAGLWAQERGGCSPNVLHTATVGASASAPQPPGPSARRFLCLECKEADRPREAQRLEHAAQHQGAPVSRRREEKAGLPRLPGPDSGAETPTPNPPPPPRPPGQLRVRRRSADYGARPPAGHLHDKGAAAARAGGAARGAPGRAQPPPRPQARSCPAKPPPHGPKIWGAGAAREPRRSAVFARGAPRGAAGLRRGTKARI